jgi:hypothetical protein
MITSSQTLLLLLPIRTSIGIPNPNLPPVLKTFLIENANKEEVEEENDEVNGAD